MKIYNLLWVIFSLPLYAQTETMLLQNAATKATSLKEEVQTMLAPLNACSNSPTQTALSCSDVTDNFCSELFNEKNEGNMKVFDGQIKAGKAKSGRLLSAIDDDKALVEALERMPEDIRKALSPEIKNLKKSLASENKSQVWSRGYSKVKSALSNALDDVADARFLKLNPKLKIEDFENFPPEKVLAYREIQRDVRDQVTIAKYAKHENWKRVENVFPEVKKNLSDYIDTMKIPAERKVQLKQKLGRIDLKLPLASPEGMLAEADCASDQVNAFYSPVTKNFTVCAGLFNTYQSAASLAFVIGHELSHAIDSENIANDDTLALSPYGQKVNKLSKTTYSCKEWDKIVEEVKPAEDFQLIGVDPLENLYSCLRGPQELEPLSKANIVNATKMSTKSIMSFYATREKFTQLVTKYKTVDKKKVANPYYFNPKLLNDMNRGYSNPNEEREVTVFEILNQNMLCELEKAKLTQDSFEHAADEKKTEIFENAMNKTSKLVEYSLEDFFKYCGKNCSDLANAGMSVNPQEKVADWFSIKAYPAYLQKIAPVHRAEASALTTALFCPQEEQESTLSAVEKEFSLETHPDNRIRRVSVYTPEISKLIGCEADKGEKGYAQCEP